MAPLTDLLSHANAAVERSRHSLAELRTSLGTEPASMSRQHRCCVEAALKDCQRRHTLVIDAWREMERHKADAMPELWPRFLVCYDDYLEAVREAKCGLAREEYLDEVAVKPIGSSGIVTGSVS